MAKSPHLAIQLGTPAMPEDYYPDPLNEPYIEITAAQLALICGEDGPAGPCRTCRYSEGMFGKVHVTGMVGEPPIETMKCRQGKLLVIVVGAAVGYGCERWEREPGADDEVISACELIARRG